MTNFTKGDVASLKARLTELNIFAAETNDGFLAYTTSEPLFCLESKSLEELGVAVAGTLSSYVSTFYSVDNVSVEVKQETIAPESIQVPVQRLKPISRLRPKFGNNGTPLGLLAAV